MNTLLINTPQNVNLEYHLASVGSRILAFAIDYALIFLYLVTTFTLLNEAGLFRTLDQWSTYGLVSVIGIPAMTYPLYMEVWLNGQTLGKRVMKLKVVKLDGTRATFYQYFIRWISNTVDILFSMGALGMAFIILTKRSQRIGDLAADTTVISLKQNIQLRQTLFRDITKTYQVIYPQVIQLSDHDINEINDIYQTAFTRKNYPIILALAARLQRVLHIEKPEGKPEDFIATLMRDHYHLYRNE